MLQPKNATTSIIYRNFFRLLRSGAFNEYEPIERMSHFKWKKLFAMAMQQDVLTIMTYGIRNHQYDNDAAIPISVADDFMKLCGQKAASNKVSIPQSQMSNGMLNKRLKALRHDELHAIDTSLESLELLNLLIYNTNKILSSGIVFGNIILIGKYLRNKGDKVDFVKLEKWLHTLHMDDMAKFEGSILITTLHFEQSELPFVHEVDKTAYNRAMLSLTSTPICSLDDWQFKQGQSGFMHNNSSVLRHNLWHKMKYLGYAPMETISNLSQSLSRSFQQIEE